MKDVSEENVHFENIVWGTFTKHSAEIFVKIEKLRHYQQYL